MGGCRCSFRNCKSATKTNGDLHFFHYPVKQRERCAEWIKNARRLEFFELPDDQLRNKVVCDLHFERWYFTNALRKRLVHNAVPTLAIGCEDEILNEQGSGEFPNIEILPANDDGTIFTLDTDSMQQKIDDPVSTYSFKNGTLIPVYHAEDEQEQVIYTIDAEEYKVVPSFNETNENNYVFIDTNKPTPVTENYEIVFNGESQQPTIEKKIHSTPSMEITTKSFPKKEPKILQPIRPQEPMEIVYLPDHTTSTTATATVAEADLPKGRDIDLSEVNITEVEVSNTSLIKKAHNKTSLVGVKKTFLKRINHHSREIATIKKTLLQSNFQKSNRLNVNAFKGKVHPTLLGALSLNLYKKTSNFTQSEVEFLTTIYKSSPECYTLLIEKLNWDLPAPSVVEELVTNKIIRKSKI